MPGPRATTVAPELNTPPGGDKPAPTPETPSVTPPPPPSTPVVTAKAGVVFLHGTGDNGDTDGLKCTGNGDDYRCMVASAQEYWTQPNVDSQRTRGDGTRRPFAVLGCPLGTRAPWTNPSPVKTTGGAGPEVGSAECVATQTTRFLDGPDGKAGTEDDITDVVIVTHSGGSNVVRYLLAQNTSRPAFARVHGATRRVVAIAPPSHGTYLANYMFRTGSLGNVLGKLSGLFGSGIGYDDDGTSFIQTDQMDASNKDPARFGSLAKDVAGIPFFSGGGTNADVTILDSSSTCAGSVEARALALLHDLYLGIDDPTTYRDSKCSDGFISCRSAMGMVNGDTSRMVFGRLEDGRSVGKVLRRNHNQSRRDCDGTDLDIRGAINGTPTFPQFMKATVSVGKETASDEPEASDTPHALVALAFERGERSRALRMPAAVAALPDAGLRWRHSVGFVRVLNPEDTLPLAHAEGAQVTLNAMSPAGVEVARFASEGRDEFVVSDTKPANDLFPMLRASQGLLPPPMMQVRAHADRATVRITQDAPLKLRTADARTSYLVEGIERAGSVRLSALPLASRFFAGGDAELDIALAAEDAVISGTAHGPSGQTAKVRVEAQGNGRYRARVQLPAAAVEHVGVWSVTLEADGRTPGGQVFARTLVVPFSYVVPVARIARVTTVPVKKDGLLRGVEVEVAVDAATGGRLGAHAYLVIERDGRTLVLHAQTSADVEIGSASLRVVFDNPAIAGATRVEVRDLALVSHDLASTLEFRARP